MLNSILEINWLAVLAATFASFVLGGIWFTLIVAKPYSAALGRDHLLHAAQSALREFADQLGYPMVVSVPVGDEAMVVGQPLARRGDQVEACRPDHLDGR